GAGRQARFDRRSWRSRQARSWPTKFEQHPGWRGTLFGITLVSRVTKVNATGAIVNDQATTKEAPQPAARNSHAILRLDDFLPYRLTVLASLTSQALSRVYSERYGIGVPEWRVLVTLGQFGMMTGKAIGAHSHMHKTKVSRAVAELERRRLVARRANR